jgi:hypothetical protein
MYPESFGAVASMALAPSLSERASFLSGGSGGLYSTDPGSPVGRAYGWDRRRPGRGYREVVSHHLEPIPGPWDEDLREFDGEDDEAIRRSAWWRWVAIIVVLAMVVATPFAYALSRLLS